MITCSNCGFDYTSHDDLEPGTGRCWRCAAKAYKKGMERMREERDKYAAALLDVPHSFVPNAAQYAAAQKLLGREGKKE